MPVMFQHIMQNTLGELNLTYCVIYLDDMIVYGHTEEEHLERLRISIGAVPRVQSQAETLQMFLFPI